MSVRIATAGNLTNDPELRFTPAGVAVVSFRIASNDRYQDRDGQWKDAEPTYLSVTAWRGLAENIAESVKKGDQVVVVGTLQGRSFETQEHEKRTVNEITAEYVGAGLTYATAVTTKVTRSPRKGE